MNGMLFKYYQAKVLLSSLSVGRVSNFLRLSFSYFFSRLVRHPFVFALPCAITVEPAGYCNLKCPECPTGAAVLTRRGGTMDVMLFETLLDSLATHLIHVNFFFQGEPFLNRDLVRMVASATKKKVYSLISTNGQLLDQQIAAAMVESQLTEIVFSVDGLTQATYEVYRVGGHLEKLVDAVKMLVRERMMQHSKYPLITLQFIAFEHNEHEVGQLQNFTKQLGADRFLIKTAQFNDFGNGSVQPPSSGKWRRYKSGRRFESTGFNHCWRQWSSCVLGWNGVVIPCCYDKNGDFAFGSALEAPLVKLWGNVGAQTFRKTILQNKYSMHICRNCPEGRGWF